MFQGSSLSDDEVDMREIVTLYSAATALIFYDYSLTISREIRQVWGRKMTTATVLYFLIRYLPILSRVLVLFSLLPQHNDKSCAFINWINEVFLVSTLVAITVISALRVYAIWSFNLPIFATVLLCGFGLPCIHLYVKILTDGQAEVRSLRPMMCQLISIDDNMLSHDTLRLSKFLLLLSRILALFWDGLVVTLIWIQTFSLWKTFSSLMSRPPLIALLLRDGTSYFAILLICNFFLLLDLRFPDYNASFDLVTALSAVLMCHFILHLREAPLASLHDGSADWYSTIHFVSESDETPNEQSSVSGVRHNHTIETNGSRSPVFIWTQKVNLTTEPHPGCDDM